MTEDSPDWMGYKIIKAIDEDGNLVTVLVDASGSIVSVMKGDYSGALHTIALDSDHRMIARTLTGIDAIVSEMKSADTTMIYHLMNFTPVPTGKLQKITNINALNDDGEVTAVYFYKIENGGTYYISGGERMIEDDINVWNGEVWLDEGAYIRIHFIGLTVGDSLFGTVNGTQISKT